MLNVKQDLNQAKYYLNIKAWDKILMWGCIPVLCLLDYVCRWLSSGCYYIAQIFCVCVWFVLTCMICYLQNQQIGLFQRKEIDTLKMLGMSNITIFLILVYHTRYLYMLVIGTYGILNIFLINTPILTLLILEYCIYWYIFIFIYFLKTWHYYRIKLGKIFYRMKKILAYVFVLALLFVILFQEQLQVILRVKIIIELFRFWYLNLCDFTNNPIGTIFIFILMFGTEFLYLNFIYSHALYDEDENGMNVYASGKTLHDVVLRFRGNRFLQILKLNYILYSRNFHCFFCKMFLGAFWFLILLYCKDKQFCYYSGNAIISIVSVLIYYRIRDDKYNLELYHATGYTMKKMFHNHCISAFFYLYNVIFAGIIFALIKGNLLLGQAGLMIVCMAYQTIVFTSFNFYFIMIRGIDVDSQIYEVFAGLVGIIISLTPFSILVPILFYCKVKKKQYEEKEQGDRREKV